MPDDPIPEELREIMMDLGRTLGRIIEEAQAGTGFLLMLFDFGEGGTTSYLSNAQREDVIKMLEEFIEKQRAEQ